MRRLVLFVAILAVLGLALAFTKPTEAQFEAELETRLVAQIDSAKVDRDGDPARAVLVATCKMGPSQCAQLIRSLASVEYEDDVLFSRARIGLGDRPAATCIGILTRIFCRRP